MAIFYNIYSDLELADLEMRLIAASMIAGDLWEAWSASDDLGPFHLEIMAEYGVDKGFKSRCFTRHAKAQSVRARDELLAFFGSLPGRKLLLNGDVLVAFRNE